MSDIVNVLIIVFLIVAVVFGIVAAVFRMTSPDETEPDPVYRVECEGSVYRANDVLFDRNGISLYERDENGALRRIVVLSPSIKCIAVREK